MSVLPAMCQCGCQRQASHHIHPFGVTNEHIAWCRHLKKLGVLTPRHDHCAKQPYIKLDSDGQATITLLTDV